MLKVNAVSLADQVHKDLVDRKVLRAYPSRNLENRVLMDLLVRKVPRDNQVYLELMADKVLRLDLTYSLVINFFIRITVTS